jgi:hypothetical protein
MENAENMDFFSTSSLSHHILHSSPFRIATHSSVIPQLHFKILVTQKIYFIFFFAPNNTTFATTASQFFFLWLCDENMKKKSAVSAFDFEFRTRNVVLGRFQFLLQSKRWSGWFFFKFFCGFNIVKKIQNIVEKFSLSNLKSSSFHQNNYKIH